MKKELFLQTRGESQVLLYPVRQYFHMIVHGGYNLSGIKRVISLYLLA